jgi:hypothetical protein
MSEPTRPTMEVVSLTDIDEELPRRGQKVYALSLGGVLVEMVWAADSHRHYVAWMPYPKVPKTVKDKLSALYHSGRSWGRHGTQVQCDGRPETV